MRTRDTRWPALAAATAVVLLAAIGRGLADEGGAPKRDETVIDAGFHHLGDSDTPEWKEASAKPEGKRLEVAFQARANPRAERTLSLVQRHVDEAWTLQVNGTEIATLRREKERLKVHYAVPAGLLRDGANSLVIAPYKIGDDITVGDIRLIAATLREVLDLRPVRVRVVDRDGGKTLPARITVVAKPAGKGPVELYYAEAALTAVRPGILYTAATGDASFEVPPGEYVLYATRGTEWGLAERAIRVVAPEDAASREPPPAVTLELGREVDTSGFVACDTHVHTVTFSGHGDASLRERQVTIAGEGVELAVATDHNHNTDYRPMQAQMKLDRYFTPVVGNEVTTKVGHFNAFPLDPKDAVPPHDSTDFPKLVAGMREKGAKVVILNHPRWPKIDTGPFGSYGLDRKTGARASGGAFTFDAMELVNSTTLLDDPLFLLTDWFALLRHGERIVAVGSSDSHTVGDPVGQGRTYVASSTDDPTKIDVAEVCRRLRAGESSVSLGIFAEVEVSTRSAGGNTVVARPGARISRPRGPLQVSLRVAAPSFVRPDRARVFLNGEVVADEAITGAEPGRPLDTRLRFTIEAPVPASRGDGWLVCVVTGPGVKGAYWPIERDYTLAATNPIWLDAGGDGAVK